MMTLTLIRNDGVIGFYTWLCKWYLDKVPRNSCSFSNGTLNIFCIWEVLNKDLISSFRNKKIFNKEVIFSPRCEVLQLELTIHLKSWGIKIT